MKNLLILIMGMLFSAVFSQSYTEKYNSLYDRYELFDSNGNMISYKKYNSLYNRWEVYEISKATPTYKSIEPVNPINWELTYKVLEYKQKKFDQGKNYVYNQIQKLDNEIINNTNLSNDERIVLRNTLTNAINEINSKGKSDFSSDSTVNNIINYIYQQYNNAITQINNKRRHQQNNASVNAPKPIISKFSEMMIKSFNKTIEVEAINVYNKNGTHLRMEKIKDKSYIMITENNIFFRNADGVDSYRDLVFKRKDGHNYRYTSKWGDVEINESLEIIKFFENNSDECYWYIIDKSKIYKAIH